jgi:hypothetical protein
MDPVRDLLNDQTFQAAVAYGGIGFVVLTLLATTRLWGRRPPAAGLVLTAATLAALGGLGPADPVGDLPAGLFVGLGLLGVAGLALEWFRGPIVVPMLALAPGAVVLAVFGLEGAEPGWVQPLVAVSAAVGGALVADIDRYQQRRGFGPTLLVITIAGVYATVPDTEHARVLLGAALPLLFCGFPTPIASLGTPGAAMATGLTLWVAAVDGAARPTAVIGAVGAFALLFAEPAGRRLLAGARHARAKTRQHNLTRHLVVVVDVMLVHALCVIWAARVAGFVDNTVASVLLLVPMAALALVVGGTLVPPPPRPRSRRGREHGAAVDG